MFSSLHNNSAEVALPKTNRERLVSWMIHLMHEKAHASKVSPGCHGADICWLDK